MSNRSEDRFDHLRRALARLGPAKVGRARGIERLLAAHYAESGAARQASTRTIALGERDERGVVRWLLTDAARVARELARLLAGEEGRLSPPDAQADEIRCRRLVHNRDEPVDLDVEVALQLVKDGSGQVDLASRVALASRVSVREYAGWNVTLQFESPLFADGTPIRIPADVLRPSGDTRHAEAHHRLALGRLEVAPGPLTGLNELLVLLSPEPLCAGA